MRTTALLAAGLATVALTAVTGAGAAHAAPAENPSKTRTSSVDGLDERCMTGRVLCISKGDTEVRWVVDGEVRVSLDARFGLPDTPTREGEFDVYWKSRDHVSSLYGSPMPFSMFFDGGQAVHYSEDFDTVGYDGGSHGCVNIRDYAKLEALFDEVNEGDKVVVY